MQHSSSIDDGRWIIVDGLTVSYGSHAALRNISVSIPEDQITAVIGPSGCGKTSFLRSINRLVDLTDDVKVAGRIAWNGTNLLEPGVDTTWLRKRIGMIAQRPNPLPMSIFDNVAYGPRIHRLKNKQALAEHVERSLQLAGLWDEVKDRLRAPARDLSLGQQQRLCLARGLAVEPEALLLDEPTSALDPISAQHIEKKLLELRGTCTFIVVTHNIHQAMRIADYVLFLYVGSLIEHGPAKEIFTNPREALTREYITGRFHEAPPESLPASGGNGAMASREADTRRGAFVPVG